MKRLFRLSLAILLLIGVFTTPAKAGRDIVKVMTRNLYLGADLEPLIKPPPEVDPIDAARAVLTQIAANNFPLRARRLATEIALTKPHLIGLQEVIDLTLNGVNLGPPFVDHLEEMLDALAAKGQNYVVAAKVVNLEVPDFQIPLDIDGDGIPDQIGHVSVVDRDVILAREDVNSTPLAGDYDPGTGTGGLCGVEIPNPVPMPLVPTTLRSTPSEDGCNYTIVAGVISPVIGPFSIERGFVGVDATVRGKTYRFVNTHLEGMRPDPKDPNSAIIQSLQAEELVRTLLATTPSDTTLILAGDFNSSPEDMPPSWIISPYQKIVGAGFADAWNTNLFKLFDQNGFTCCQDNDLLNTTSLLDERIDIIFVRNTSFRSLAFVTGKVPIFPLRLPPNWASDHGGVFSELIFR